MKTENQIFSNEVTEFEATINELQEKAANALNDLLTALKVEQFKIAIPLHLYSIAFYIVEDDANGFKFTPKDLTDIEPFKYEEREPGESQTISKPGTPTFKDVTGKNRPKTITRGVPLE
jgi:hypothetical protein